MIRYDVDFTQLRAEVQAVDPRWPAKAAARTAKFVKAGRYSEKSTIWGAARTAYMRAQKFKCIFCERQFENELYGKIEFDVEHFRPKSSVVPWPDATRHPRLAYRFPTGAASETGYYWLAYNLENYAASCAVCNSVLKSNYFPVAKSRGSAPSPIAALAAEDPFLCYPLGTGDADPEQLVTFVATVAKPMADAGHPRNRGQIIIDFFDLNGREMLHRQRAQMISLLGGALSAIHKGTATPADHQLVQQMLDPAVPHAGCVRAFRRLFAADPAKGQRVYDLCRAYAFDQTASAPPEL